MNDEKFPASWYMNGEKVEGEYKFKDLIEPISCKENKHDFQYIEKVTKSIPASCDTSITVEYKYYYIFYCKKCCYIIHLESPI